MLARSLPNQIVEAALILTGQTDAPTLTGMDLQLPEHQANELAVLSSRTGRSASDLVVEAVDRLLAHEKWFEAQVQLGIEQIARGEFLEEGAMDARVAKMIRP